MKRNVIISAASLFVFATAVGFTFQQPDQKEPLAEQQYKNIQIFKGRPASQVRPAMDAFTSALGVGCDFCHVTNEKGEGVWDKDDKKPKQTAREMFRMMENINKENFEGRMEVNCATCHQGHESPSRVAPIGQPRLPEQPARGANDPSLPTADSLVDKYVTAEGGTAVGNVKSISIKGKVTTGFGAFDFETYAKTPDKFTRAVILPNGVYTEASNGTEGWSHFNTETENLRGSELARHTLSSPLSAIHVKEAFTGFRRVRKDTLNGKDVFIVGAQSATEGLQSRLYFDATTGMLLRKWTTVQTVAGPILTTEDFSDYRDIGGVKIPYQVALTNSNGVWTFVASDIKVNADIPDAKFEQPK